MGQCMYQGPPAAPRCVRPAVRQVRGFDLCEAHAADLENWLASPPAFVTDWLNESRKGTRRPGNER
jgi:hypothetical protein